MLSSKAERKKEFPVSRAFVLSDFIIQRRIVHALSKVRNPQEKKNFKSMTGFCGVC